MLPVPCPEKAMPRIVRLIGLLSLLLPLPGRAADDGYSAGIHQWQRQHDQEVRTGGWLLLVGRYLVPPGASPVGSDPAAAILLPESAPQRLGVITRTGSVFHFEPAPGTGVTIDGTPASGISELTTASGKGRVGAGTVSFAIRKIGEDFYALVQDYGNPAVRNFKGTEWFPVHPGYRVSARFVAFAQPQSVPVPMTHIESRTVMDSTGEVVFRLNGAQMRLKSFVDGDQLFIMFRDRTNGHDTYGGGRFMYAPLPKDGATTLDFNEAFNPFCSVNDYVVCPVVPAENRLGVSIAAGQMYHGGKLP
jgi:uncharacterized protein (DUF1684 family)